MNRFPVMGLAALLVLSPLVPAQAQQGPDEQLAAASALFDAQKYAGAAKTLEAFLAANPKHPQAGAAALALGRCRTELKQYAQAIPAYQKAVAAHDPKVTTFAELGLGEAALQTSQWSVAAEALNAATKQTLTPEQGAIAWNWLGQADYQLGKYAPAEDAYRKVAQDYPKSDYAADATYGAGLAALKLGQTDDARRFLRAVLDKFPQSEDRTQARLLIAQLDLNGKNYSEARSGFEGVLSASNADADTQTAAQTGLVNALLELGDYASATTRLQAVLAKLPPTDPQHFAAELSLGNCLYRQKKYEPALAAYQDAAKASDPAVAGQGTYWAANAALALKQSSEAAALFAQASTRFPKADFAAKAQLKAGDALLAAKQNEKAISAYQAVSSRFPQSAEAGEARKALAELMQDVSDPSQLATALKTLPTGEREAGTLRLARLYLDQKKYAAAITALAPLKTPEAQYLTGLAWQAQDKPTQAAPALAAAVQTAADAQWLPDAQTQLAWTYVSLKQPAKAERAADAALGLKSHSGYSLAIEQQARLALLQADLDQQKWDDVAAVSKDLQANNPAPETLSTILYAQAWALDKQSKADQSAPLWEQLAREYPQSEYAPEALLHLADARFSAEKYDEARDKYKALLATYPKSAIAPEARFKLGSALFNLNQFADAAAQFDSVAADKTAGDYLPEALYWAGAAWEKAGKKTDAIQRLSRLVSEYPASTRVANAKVRLAALKAVSGG